MYTLMMSTMGRKVIAVDPIGDNLVYIWINLKLGNRKFLVTFAHNAVR